MVGTGAWAGFGVTSAVNFVNNAVLEIGNNVVTSFGTSGVLGTGTNAANLILDSGAYFNLSNGTTTVTSETVNSLTGAGTVTNLATNSGTATLIVSGSANTTFSGQILDGANLNGVTGIAAQGAVAITKSGAGILTLSGVNSYSGLTTVSSGTLLLGNASALGAGAVTASGGALDLGGFSPTVGAVTISGNATSIQNGSLTGSSYAGANVSGTVTISANLLANGSAGLTKTGAGLLSLTGSNSFTGTTAVNGGTLSLGSADALAGGGNISFGGGTLQITAASNVNDYTGRILGSAGAVSIDTNGQNVTFANPLDATNVGGLSKSGSGTLILSVANSHSGATTVSGGTLQMGNAGALGVPGGNLAVNAGTLELNGYSISVGLLSGSAGGSIISTSTAAIVLTASGSATSSYGGILNEGSGSMALVKTGTGVLTLTGSNSFSGGLTIAAGSVVTGSNTAAFGSGLITIGDSTGSANASLETVGNTGIVSGTFSNPITVAAGSSGTATLKSNNGTWNYTGGILLNKDLMIANTATGGGTNLMTLTGNITGSGNLIVNSSGKGSISLSGSSINNIGTITNSGTASLAGTGLTISGNVGSNVSGIVQSGSTMTVLTGSNSYGSTTIASGTLQVGNGGSAGTLGLGDVTNNGTLAFNRSDAALAVSNNISGTGGLQQIGSGVTTLSGSNSYTGATSATNGTLIFSTPNALSPGSAVSATAPATVGLAVGAGAFGTSNVDAFFANTMPGVTLGAGAGAGIDTTAGDWVYATTQSSAHPLIKLGANTLTLGGSNSFTGMTVLGGAVDLGGNTQTVGALSVPVATVSGDTISNGSLIGTSYSVSNPSGTVTLSANLLANGSAGFTKSGSGTAILSGNNSYTGGTILNAGTLQAGSANALSAGGASLTINAGTLDLGGNSVTVGAVSVTTGSTTIQNGSLIGSSYAVSNATGNAIISANLLVSGSGGLTKTGAGTLTLSGNSTFTGAAFIQAGVVSVSTIGLAGAAGNLGASPQLSGSFAPIVIYNTAVLNYTGAGETTDRNILLWDGDNRTMTVIANGSGALNLSGTITNRYANATANTALFVLGGASTGANSVSGAVTEGGWGNHVMLSKQGTGTWVLSGTSNTYQAVTDVENGVLQFASIANAGTVCSLGESDTSRSFAFLPSIGQTTASNTPGVVPYQIALGSGSTAGVLQYIGVTSGSSNRGVGLNGNGTLSAAAGAGNLTLSGTISPVVSTNVTLTLDANNNGSNTVSGVIADLAGQSTTASTSGSNNLGYISVASTAGFTIGQSVSTGVGLAANAVITGITTGTLYVYPNTNGIVPAGATITAGGSLMSVIKSGTGTWTLSAANTYTGPTTINAGTLQLGNGGTTGSLSPTSTITNNGTLVFNHSNTLTQGTHFAASIGGSGQVIQSGSGTTILNTANSYSGGTTVNKGTLQVGNASALGSGGLTVNNGVLDLHGNSVSVTEFGGTGGKVTNLTSGSSNLTANVNGTSTYAGAIVDGAGSVALTMSGTGTLVLSGSIRAAGLNANGGSVQIAQSGSIGAISIGAAGKLELAANNVNTAKVLDTSSLTIATGGTLDLWDNALIVRDQTAGVNQGANLSTIQGLVNTAFDNGNWDKPGITSSSVIADLSAYSVLTVMVYDNTVLGVDSFEGINNLMTDNGGNQVMLKTTYLGDFDGNGIVNSADYGWLDFYYGYGLTVGDLNGDGQVNSADYNGIDYGYGYQAYGVLAGGAAAPAASAASAAAPASPEAVPEPGTLGFLLTSALGLLGFRRQRKNR